MARYVAILRGINVGGRRKILMADLREMMSALGFDDVKTYIQSGNVLFTARKGRVLSKMEEVIHLAIKKKYDFEVPVIIREDKEWQTIVEHNVFVEKYGIENLFVTFLKELPEETRIEDVLSYDYSPDKIELVGKNIYGYCEGKYHKTKYSNKFFETKLKSSATTRNWNTVMKIVDLLKQ